jgi:hypothetical protein
MKRGEKYIVLLDRFTHFTYTGSHAVRGATRCIGWAKSYVTLLFGTLVRRFVGRFHGNHRIVLVTTAPPGDTDKRLEGK